MHQPLFSIVIPTRNRPALVGHAIRSALSQSDSDCEIVISDNSTDAATREVANQVGENRLKYVAPPQPLGSMWESWEFALEQANGRYVTFLCDDDALSPLLLERVRAAIEEHPSADLVTWGTAGYHHPNWVEAEKRNTLLVTPCTKQVQVMGSESSLRHIFDRLWPTVPVPKMLQSFSSRGIIDRVKATAGSFFIPSCPDLSTAVFTLAKSNTYIHLDEPLMISGAAQESTGSTQYVNKGETLLRSYREIGGASFFAKLPLKGFAGINYCAQTLVDAKERMPNELATYEVNWALYFSHYANGLRVLRSLGCEVEPEQHEYEQVFARQTPKLQRAVWKHSKFYRPSIFRRAARRLIEGVPALKNAESTLRFGLRETTPIRLFGSESGFCNIFECAQRLPTFVETTLSAPTGCKKEAG